MEAHVVVVPTCKQQLLWFHCDLPAGHEGLHRDTTTRSASVHWPSKTAEVRSQARSRGELDPQTQVNPARTVPPIRTGSSCTRTARGR